MLEKGLCRKQTIFKRNGLSRKTGCIEKKDYVEKRQCRKMSI